MMLDKIIFVVGMIIFLSIAYKIISKIFFKGVKITKFINSIINKFNKKKGGA